MLRSKVIKILDTHFSKKSTRLESYDMKMKHMQESFKNLKDQELLEKSAQPGYDKNISKNIDYPFYQPDLKSLKYEEIFQRKKKRTLEPLKPYREPTIIGLCEYLTYDEIERVSQLY